MSNALARTEELLSRRHPFDDWFIKIEPKDVRAIVEDVKRSKEECRSLNRELHGCKEKLDRVIEERDRLEKHISDCRKGMIQFCWHSYADLDGNMDWPNNKEGDLIKAMYEDAVKAQALGKHPTGVKG